MRGATTRTPGGATLVFLTLALLLAGVAAAAVVFAGCGSAQPAGSTAQGPATSGSSAGGPTSTGGPPTTGTAGQTTVASAPATTATSPSTSPTTAVEASVALGEEARVGEWKVTVVSVTAPATELIAYANEFNEPPAPGFDYMLVTVQATYTGGGSADFSLDIASTFVGSEGGEYGAPQGRAEAPQPIEEAGEVGPGGTVSGDLVFEVSWAEMAGGRVRLAPASAPAAAVFFSTR